MIRVVEDFKEWDELASEADVFHLSGYSRAFAETGGNHPYEEHFCGKPALVVYEEGLGKLIYPVMIRGIHGTEFRDLISPYGYSGPYTSGNVNVAKWHNQMNLFCREQGIVSEFLRLHPFFLQSFPIIKYKGDITYKNLEEKDLLAGLEKKCRNAVTRSQRSGLRVSVLLNPKPKELLIMSWLYNSTMLRNNASQKYLLSQIFFKKLFSFLPDNSLLFLVFKGDLPVSGAVFLYKKPYFHYYLAGCSEEFKNLNPNNLLLWEAMKYAKEKGFKTFNLGGGVGGKGDSLKKFKQGFSKQKKPFHAIEVIHMPKEYAELSKGKEKGFFPEYRGRNK